MPYLEAGLVGMWASGHGHPEGRASTKYEWGN